MLDGFRNTIKMYNMFEPGDCVVAGVSGGADSVALLYGLLAVRDEIPITIAVAHVNHNLRGGDALADEAFVAALCEQLQLPIFLYSADVRGHARDMGLSIEEAGRQLRYRYLQTALGQYKAQKIAVAHNQNDNAETVLMHLCRGAGTTGLKGISPVRDNIVRPLIETPRQVIEQFLNHNGISYRTDASNFDNQYLRNRIRHNVLPAITQHISEEAVALMTRSAAHVREEDAFLEQLAEQAFFSVREHDDDTQNLVRLNIETLSQLPLVLQKRVIRAGLRIAAAQRLRDISAAHIAQVLSLLQCQTGKKAVLPYGTRARREYEQLVLYQETETAAPFCFALTLEEPVYVPALHKYMLASLSGSIPEAKDIYTKIFNYDKIANILELRTRRPGDRIQLAKAGAAEPPGSAGSTGSASGSEPTAASGGKKLQDYFTDRKIPRHQRDLIPLLADGSRILWIMDDKNRTHDFYKPVSGCQTVTISIYTDN